MLGVLKSIKTALYLLGTGMVIFLAGSVYIPNNLDIFSEINDYPLFKWLFANLGYIDKTYWIFASIVVMAALSLNMVVCTVDAIVNKLSRKGIIQKLSPHIVHTGVMLVLFGHLVSGALGFKKDIPARVGDTVTVNNLEIQIKDLNFVTLRGEDQERWRVSLLVRNREGSERVSVAEPASPVFESRLAIYAKSAEHNGRILLGVVYDPGVRWEISGAVIFVLGSAGLFWSRYNRLST